MYFAPSFMGIVQKQSIRSSLFIFLGFGIGAVNILILFPKYLSAEQLGLTRVVMDTGLTLATLCTLGAIPVINKFFPFHKTYLNPQKNDLPLLTLIICLTGFALMCAAGFLFKDFIIRKFGGKSPLFAQYFYLIYPFTFLMLLFTWMEAFGWAFKKAATTSFLKETLVRLSTTLLIIALAAGLLSFTGFMNAFGLLYLLPVLILFITLRKTKAWRFNPGISSTTRRLKGKMISFGSFVFIGQFLNVLARTNDTFLIAGIEGLTMTAVFTIGTYIVALLEIPQRSLTAITVPVLAESWKDRNMANISMMYQKSVSNLMVIGLFMLGILWLNAHNLVRFLHHDYEAIAGIILIMGIGKFIDLATGINSQIIGTSNYWRFDFVTNMVYTLLSIPFNFLLIKKFGIMGAAWANLISLTTYNLVRYLFLLRKFNMQPYGITHLYTILIGAGCSAAVYFIPRLSNLYLDTILRTACYAIPFAFLIIKTNVTPDLNGIIFKLLYKMKLSGVVKLLGGKN
jgi:O-antigen/teichoic acid export membrane protein